MFAGGRRRSSNNVRAMQLFHELKQQFPTVPDHVVSACIANNEKNSPDQLQLEIEKAAAALQPGLMGHTPSEEQNEPTLPPIPPKPNNAHKKNEANPHIDPKTNHKLPERTNHINNVKERTRSDMNQSESVLRRFQNSPEEPKKHKRPDTLELNSLCKIRQSDKCKDVHKLLTSEKPPRSPVTSRRLNKTDVSSDPKPQTVETPTQTSDTLLSSPNNVNLSLNVNVDLLRPKRTSALHVVPQQPWCQETTVSPRSFTSVNLTLRAPTTEPQPPIDITSQNSSLTYSTSSFDSQKGLQSRLQITVSPTGGSVSSVRTRPRSYHPESEPEVKMSPKLLGSLQDLTTSPVLMKQQARIDRLRIELKSEKTRLIAMQSEVVKLESSTTALALQDKTDDELEKQLQKEIRHLRGQCERLTIEVDRETKTAVPLGETSEEFYRNIYTGQRGPVVFGRPMDNRTDRLVYNQSSLSENYGPRWSCPMCTFQNHPLLDKCEECEMARIVHGTANNLKHDQNTNQILMDLLNVRNDNNQHRMAANAANSLLNFVTKDEAQQDFMRRHSEPNHLQNSARNDSATNGTT